MKPSDLREIKKFVQELVPQSGGIEEDDFWDFFTDELDTSWDLGELEIEKLIERKRLVDPRITLKKYNPKPRAFTTLTLEKIDGILGHIEDPSEYETVVKKYVEEQDKKNGVYFDELVGNYEGRQTDIIYDLVGEYRQDLQDEFEDWLKGRAKRRRLLKN